MLAVPFAFKLVGWAALPTMVLLALVFTYTGCVIRTVFCVQSAQLVHSCATPVRSRYCDALAQREACHVPEVPAWSATAVLPCHCGRGVRITRQGSFWTCSQLGAGWAWGGLHGACTLLLLRCHTPHHIAKGPGLWARARARPPASPLPTPQPQQPARTVASTERHTRVPTPTSISRVLSHRVHPTSVLPSSHVLEVQEGTNLAKLQPLSSFGIGPALSEQTWMCIVWALVLPSVLMHNYSLLSYLSAVGLAFSAVLPFIGACHGLWLALAWSHHLSSLFAIGTARGLPPLPNGHYRMPSSGCRASRRAGVSGPPTGRPTCLVSTGRHARGCRYLRCCVHGSCRVSLHVRPPPPPPPPPNE